jgi:hypothetical protein
MSNRYREHRIRGSLANVACEAPTDPRIIAHLAEEVHHTNRGVFFSREQLDKMPLPSRALIEGEARRLYGKRQR